MNNVYVFMQREYLKVKHFVEYWFSEAAPSHSQVFDEISSRLAVKIPLELIKILETLSMFARNGKFCDASKQLYLSPSGS